MGKQRRSFTPEFKQEAADLCRRSGKSECQVARELGIPQPTYNRWMRQVAGDRARTPGRMAQIWRLRGDRRSFRAGAPYCRAILVRRAMTSYRPINSEEQSLPFSRRKISAGRALSWTVM